MDWYLSLLIQERGLKYFLFFLIRDYELSLLIQERGLK